MLTVKTKTMKQSEYKEKIREDLIKMGFKVEHDQVSKKVGQFYVLIFLSKQARVLIETSGAVGSYYVTIEQTYDSFSDTNAKKLVKTWEKYIRKCEAFNKTK